MPEAIAARLIGSLFVERGLVSESQIRVALEIQRETGEQLGKILVEQFGVSREELTRSWSPSSGATMSGDPPAPGPRRRSSETWRPLGEIFVTRGFVSEEELDERAATAAQDGRAAGRGARRARRDQQVRARRSARRADVEPGGVVGRAGAAEGRGRPAAHARAGRGAGTGGRARTRSGARSASGAGALGRARPRRRGRARGSRGGGGASHCSSPSTR